MYYHPLVYAIVWTILFTSFQMLGYVEGKKFLKRDQIFGPKAHFRLADDGRRLEPFSPGWAKRYFDAPATSEGITRDCHPELGSFVWRRHGLGSNINSEYRGRRDL